jgi:hypothetical protein
MRVGKGTFLLVRWFRTHDAFGAASRAIKFTTQIPRKDYFKKRQSRIFSECNKKGFM